MKCAKKVGGWLEEEKKKGDSVLSTNNSPQIFGFFFFAKMKTNLEDRVSRVLKEYQEAIEFPPKTNVASDIEKIPSRYVKAKSEL